jgi:predicted permease
MQFTLLGRAEPERVSTGVVSAEFFDVLGVTPELGRTFRPEDDDLGAEAVLILSNGYWQRSFGGATDIVGRTFEMNDKTHTVVGVLPPSPQFPTEHDVYMPTSACPFRSAAEQQMADNRSAFRAITAFGRLGDGVTAEAANTDFSTIASRFERDYPETYPRARGYEVSVAPLQRELTAGARPTLLILLATSALVLFIACTNVVNLAVARLMRRDREMAVRASLGAGRGRLVQQALVESTMLALLGGGAGLFLAYQGLDMLVAFAARFTPRAEGIEIDGWVLLFTIAISLATGIIVAVAPALMSRIKLATALRDGGHTTEHRSRQRVRGLLIAGQVAVAVVLLVGAGLMLRSLYRLQQVQAGVHVDNVLVARISPNWSRYQTPDDARRFFDALLPRLREIPGVDSASVGSGRPLSGQAPTTTNFRIENIVIEEGEIAPQVATRVASPDFFRTMGIPLRSGRSFTELDHAGSTRVGIINQSLAKQYWSGTDPIGQRVAIGNSADWIQIVGVVGDVLEQGLDAEPVGAIYLSRDQAFWANTIAVRTPFDPTTIIPQVKDAVHSVDPQQPVDDFQTVEEIRHASMASPRLTAVLLGLFALLALVIAATGISGVIAYSVSQRTHEIGIRMALGAQRSQVLGMVLRQGLSIVAAGLAVGIVLALFASRFMAELLFDTSHRDALTFGAVMVILLVAAVGAAFFPARRAAGVNPTIALRSE